MSDELRGLIANIQDYAVHDGYGLRSLVFFKGCPLKCDWCQNPETWSLDFDVMYHEKLCVGCGRCAEICDAGAIIPDSDKRIDRSKCNNCMKCVETCSTNALSRVGNWMTVEQVLRVVMQYKPFYDGSDRGGVTLSGGEALYQPKFAVSLLKHCKEAGLHTALETCGYASYETLKAAAEHLDLVLYDLKHMDELAHKRGTGVSNKLIRENLERLCQEEGTPEIVIRIPLIPGYNDDEKNIRETVKYIHSLKIKKLDLLPFNELPVAKYKALGMPWKYIGKKRQADEHLDSLKDLAQAYGLEVTIGGLW
ncbi:glycyl-radical enzyme activating protein [Neomoorella mulderi]|nr:glycyl-radical enzyme activating protein [Moorella mulderi]